MTPVTMKEIEKSIVPISRLNKGEANKVFQELHQDGVKAVFKNNRREAILLDPEVYDHLIELLEDQLLYEEMEKRIASFAQKGSRKYTFADAMEEFGITEDALEEDANIKRKSLDTMLKMCYHYSQDKRE